MAETVLITFLGRVPKTEGQYRTTCYKWPGDDEQPCSSSQKVAFFGLDILRRLSDEIDRVVVLGTTSSMWDHLFEVDIELGGQEEAARLELVEQVERKSTDQSLLSRLAPILEGAWGKPVNLEIVPEGFEPTEQVLLFETLNKQVPVGSRLILDITHGYRHLPMIMLLVAMQLKQLKDVSVYRVLYGAYDPDSGLSKVVDLRGLLDIASWMQALMTFDKDGDYGVFADLINAPTLKEAAFFERTTNPIRAREKLQGTRSQISQKHIDDPVWNYFQDQMMQGFEWIDRPTRHDWESALARRYLDRGDYLRSILYALESCISQQVHKNKGDHKSFDDRNRAHEELKRDKNYKRLNNLRNAMAHGTKSIHRETLEALENEACLSATLKKLYDKLLP